MRDVRLDVTGYRRGRRLFVEMYFRHRVDEAKRAKLALLGVPAIEIDLSDLNADATFALIAQRVIDGTQH